ncbi:DHA2 family efflux MFS transporter permease subunit [Streptomyces sp. NBC_00334]|uniref:DHA2 family efflux MFS transporter permease subunit n=1 Tax=Streptomyces sp. NBC_00334 TaxID=2975713 RepID=UPI002E2837D7|nr:DHA2 family efflux MFS transporter permease subunit [Streptomyces sp. NBC_00334]
MSAQTQGHPVRTFVIAAVAMFITSLDNLVVTTALPAIRDDLNAGLDELEWTVNAFTLTFAVFLMTGSALGDRFGRRRLFMIGTAVFTAASAVAAMSDTANELIVARAVQGVGGAIVVPLTLTLLSAAVPPAKRGAALGAWGAVAGLAIALGPVVGGAIVEGASWQWIFWINVPLGLVLLPLSKLWLAESRGAAAKLDLVGTALLSLGLFGVVLGLVRGGAIGWTSGEVLAGFVVGGALILAFLVWENRVRHPMLPLGLFRGRAFSMTNLASVLMYFGMFGAIFLVAQFLQTAQGYSPLEAGLRTLPWTAMPMVVAPIAGALSDRFGGRIILAIGFVLQAIGLGWFALIASPTVGYGSLVAPFAILGVGMSLFYAPVVNMVFSSVRRDQEGIASGVNNAGRELGGVLGVAVLAAVFAAQGGYETPQLFVDGLVPAVWVGAAVVLSAAVASMLIPTGLRPVGAAAEAEAAEAAATGADPAAARPADAATGKATGTPPHATIGS